jgi:hypothetical protein
VRFVARREGSITDAARRLALVAFGAAALHAAPARAADADLSAVAPADGGAFVAGSTSSWTDLRSGILGRWSAGRGAFDWLWRIDAGPATIDALTDVVPAAGAVFAVGSSNGSLSVAKLDPATGTLLRSCRGVGIATHAFGAPFVPGRAVFSGGDLVVVGGTIAWPSQGVIAAIDGNDCSLVGSALVSAPNPGVAAGFAAVDAARDGSLLVSGFAGSDAAVWRFDAALHRLGERGYDLGRAGDAFTDIEIAGDRGVAVAGTSPVTQCIALPALDPDAACGDDGRRELGFAAAGGVALAALPSGGWLAGGGDYGLATGLRPALGFLGAGSPPATVFGALGSLPSSFADVTASDAGIAGVGVSGYFGSRRPFVFGARLDGGAGAFVPLSGLESAAPAPLEPAPAAPPATPDAAPDAARAPAPPAGPALALARFGSLAVRPARDGSIGALMLQCARDCRASGVLRALGDTLGSTVARLRAGETRRIPLRLTAAGGRTLARHAPLRVTVRVTVTDAAGSAETIQKRLTLHAPRPAAPVRAG